MKPKWLVVRAEVRYWEDATVNGVEDSEGCLIPHRKGSTWAPSIDIETGYVCGWPANTTADVHYKVCDAGEYWLQDADGRLIYKWRGHYVPNDFLCVGDNGFGDYIILKIGEGGKIEGWDKPLIDFAEWEVVES